MIGVYSLCTVWGEPLAQTAQSFMPELICGADRNLQKVTIQLFVIFCDPPVILIQRVKCSFNFFAGGLVMTLDSVSHLL